MNKIIICRGIPASGKSTWAKQWVLEDPEHRIRINQDDIRNMLGKYWVSSRENLVSYINNAIITKAVSLNYDIVIDNINLNPKNILYIEDIILLCNMKYIIEYKDFFDVPLSVCIERDKKRTNPIGEEVIRSFYNRYKNKYNLNGN
jgi:predicted kinase